MIRLSTTHDLRASRWLAGIAAAALCVGGAAIASAQEDDRATEVAPTTIFTRHGTDRVWLSGQVNVIVQRHGEFPSPYSGEHSLRASPERRTSTLLTLFTGVR